MLYVIALLVGFGLGLVVRRLGWNAAPVRGDVPHWSDYPVPWLPLIAIIAVLIAGAGLLAELIRLLGYQSEGPWWLMVMVGYFPTVYWRLRKVS